MRPPTPEQRAKEAAILHTSLADLVLVLLLLIFATTTGSLTLVSKVFRIGLLLLIQFYSLFVLRAVHRDNLKRFRFGISKIEQMCKLSVGAALLFSGIWVLHHVIDTLLITQDVATPLGLAMAATVSATNVLINVLGLLAMVSAAKGDDSAIYRVQIRSRVAKLISSLMNQTTITIAALATDPVIASWMDGLGATLTAGAMVTIGFKMIYECLPELLDRPLPETVKRAIETELLSAGFASVDLVGVRTRRAGNVPHVELALALAGHTSLAEYSRRATDLEDRLKILLQGADVSVVVGVDQALQR